MKKYIIIAVLSLVIIPQITLASWWNPTTWRVFSKTPQTKISVILVATSTATSTTPKTDVSEIEKLKKEISEPKKTKSVPIPTIKAKTGKLDLSKYGVTPVDSQSPVTYKISEQKFKETFDEMIKRGFYTKEDISVWFNGFHKNRDGTYSPNNDNEIYDSLNQSLLKKWVLDIPQILANGKIQCENKDWPPCPSGR